MDCQRCGERPAVLHLTQIVQNEVRSLHLCDRCGQEEGLAPGTGGQQALPLAGLLTQLELDPGLSASEEIVCSFCRMTMESFRTSGRLGCPHCWSTFDGPLRSLLRKVQGGTRHVGKLHLPPAGALGAPTALLEGLRNRMSRAIEREDFERAAELRDEIRRVEGGRDE